MPKEQVSGEALKNVLSRNVQETYERGHLEAVLRSGRKLRVKLGIDPTGEKIHIGRAVVLWKLREFQDLGHKIVLIIGDFTAQIGDPSDKLEKRPFLTKAQVKENLKSYLPQIGKIINLKKTEVRYNSEWLAKLTFQEISQLAESFTVQQMIERKNFKDRLLARKEISMRETLYPLMQGYDSVAVRADVELGGTDQLFNLLAGRKIQERYGQKPQDVMTTKMLLGLDGRKMSTSWGNVINVTDAPDEQFGKIMSMRDEMIEEYERIATHLEPKKFANPKDRKERLAKEIVHIYHGEKAAEKAQEDWRKRFSKKDFSGELPELKSPKSILLLELVLLSGVAKSRSQAWRLIEGGAVSIDGEIRRHPRKLVTLKGGEVLKVGSHHFFRIKI